MMITREHKFYRTIIIMALIISIVTLSISYSAFNSYLEIRSKTTIENRSWLIKLNNVSEPLITGEAKSINSPIVTSTNIVFDILLSVVGDEIDYTFEITNEGTINAKLIEIPSIEGIGIELTDKVSYTITHVDGSEIKANETLNAGETKKFKICIKYNALYLMNTNMDVTCTFLYAQQ